METPDVGELPAPCRVGWYAEADAGEWDAFVSDAVTGTFLHSRRFLGYHGSRFEDRSLVFRDDAGRVCGLLPAALDPACDGTVTSHPGATYGGLLWSARHAGIDVPMMLRQAGEHFAAAGLQRWRYKAVPVHLHALPTAIDVWALWQLGAMPVRRDLWNVIDLRLPRELDKDRRRCLRRAAGHGIQVVEDRQGEYLAAFHAALTEALASRHGVAPVHALPEMRELQRRFPGDIALWVALDGERRFLAGEWRFLVGSVWHGQYGASRPEGRTLFAQDLLQAVVIDAAQAAGCRYYSFGASTDDGGRRLNEGLFRYKSSFGEGTFLQETCDISLDPFRAGGGGR